MPYLNLLFPNKKGEAGSGNKGAELPLVTRTLLIGFISKKTVITIIKKRLQKVSQRQVYSLQFPLIQKQTNRNLEIWMYWYTQRVINRATLKTMYLHGRNLRRTNHSK